MVELVDLFFVTGQIRNTVLFFKQNFSTETSRPFLHAWERIHTITNPTKNPPLCNMAELFDEAALLLGGQDQDAKPIGILPDHLDYSYVDRCKDIEEIRAIYNALVKGEHGRYPHLEETVKNKLVAMLPEKESKKIAAMSSTLSYADTKAEKEGLLSWFSEIESSNPRGIDVVVQPTRSTCSIPVRNVSNHITTAANTLIEENHSMSLVKDTRQPDTRTNPLAYARKEKLSTKQYFEAWDKFDPDAADPEDSDDDEGMKQPKPTVSQQALADAEKSRLTQREQELLHLQERLSNNELSLVERKFMSLREKEKGNEFFKMGENYDADACYSKSIMLDETNAKAFANRAAVSLRLSKYYDAIADCSEAIKLDSTYIKAISRRAMIYHKTGQHELAVADFRTCDELDPDAGYSKMIVQSEQKHKDELAESLHQQTKATLVIEEICDDDDIEEVYTPEVLKSIEQENKVDSSLQRDATSIPDQVNSKHSSSTIHSNDKSSQVWKKISIVETSESNDESSIQGDQHMRRHDIVVDGSDSGDEDDTVERSHRLKEEGNKNMTYNQLETAIQLYSEAISLDRSNASALNNRSLAYIKTKQYDEAIQDTNKCLALDPNNIKALYCRGLARMMSSQKVASVESAQSDFQTALSLRPPQDQAKALSRKMQECEKLLLLSKSSHEASEAKKTRNHDSQALCF